MKKLTKSELEKRIIRMSVGDNFKVMSNAERVMASEVARILFKYEKVNFKVVTREDNGGFIISAIAWPK